MARRRSSGGIWIAGFLILGLLGITGFLVAEGLIDLPFDLPFGKKDEERFEQPPGTVPVPVAPRPIPAYTKITRDHLFQAGGRPSVIFLKPEQLPGGALTDIGDIVGRVLAADKPRGRGFLDSDFLPKGTRAGITAGIPPGKRALRIDAQTVTGFHDLHVGDHFDLLATLPVQASPEDLASVSPGGSYAPLLRLEAKLGNLHKGAVVHVLVQDGVCVSPVIVRAEPTTIRSLTQGTSSRRLPKEEVWIAVDPDEVAPLLQAQAVEASLVAVARSGHPDDPADLETPELPPMSPFGELADEARGGTSFLGDMTVIEQIKGTERALLAVPRRRSEEAVALEIDPDVTQPTPGVKEQR
ncbi:MAG: hypothetical protein RL885_03940 [Planctomycetota bacterium]